MQATNNLRRNNGFLSKSLQKLSSGYRINVAADNPAGLVISEQLRAQMVGINQAVENSEQAVNLISTAEGALAEMNNLLKSIRHLGIHAANEGTVDPDQIAADQAQVDSAIRSIDRIANTTKYAKKYLFNGSQEYNVNITDTADFDYIDVNRANFAGSPEVAFAVDYVSVASRATLQFTAAAGAAESGITMAISGNKGTDYITIQGNATSASIANAINSLSANTGVYATVAGSAFSSEFGSDEFIRLKVIEANGTGYLSPGSDYGADAVASVNGQLAVAKGLELQVDNSAFGVKLRLASGLAAGGTSEFTALGGGMKFQLGDFVNPNEQEYIAIRSMNSVFLGQEGTGFLNQLRTGGAFDLTNDSSQAVRIIDKAIDIVSTTRSRLGAFQKNSLETNINSLSVALENITASESRIRDANMAEETTEFTKNQILVQSSTAILAQANLASQTILQLLQ